MLGTDHRLRLRHGVVQRRPGAGEVAGGGAGDRHHPLRPQRVCTDSAQSLPLGTIAANHELHVCLAVELVPGFCRPQRDVAPADQPGQPLLRAADIRDLQAVAWVVVEKDDVCGSGRPEQHALDWPRPVGADAVARAAACGLEKWPWPSSAADLAGLAGAAPPNQRQPRRSRFRD